MMPKRKQRMNAAQRAEREKYNLVQKLNKRIRDTVYKVGVQNKTVEMWRNKLQSKGFETITAYDRKPIYDDEGEIIDYREDEYELISRSSADLAKMSMEDLRRLDKQIPTWSKTKAAIMEEMNREQPDNKKYTRDNQPTMQEMIKFSEMHYEVARMFENNAELFYMLINNTQWEDIRDYSFEDIYNELQKIDQNNYKWKDAKGNVIHPSEVGKEYEKRRKAKIAARDAALANAYKG